MRTTRIPLALGLATALLALAGPPARAQAPAPGPATPRLWAVIVTIEQYGDPVPPRPGVSADGRKLARWVAETAGWGFDNVLELHDGGAARAGDPAVRATPLRPTRQNLDFALEKWLPHRARNRGDVALLVFVGRGTATAAGESLLPIDFKPGEAGWSPDRAIGRLIGQSRCSAVLSWIDAPVPDLAAPPGRPVEAGERLLRRLARWPESSAWMASGEPAGSLGSPFHAALRESLGDGRRPLQATLADLDLDPRLRGLRFRRLGGVPAGLSLARDRFAAPKKLAGELLVQKGHADRVGAIAMRADGPSMATASDDSTIRLWDPSAPERALARVLPEFRNGTTALAFGPDGRHLAGGDGMGEVRVWDLDSANTRPIAPEGPSPHSSLVRDLAFLPAAPGPRPPDRLVSVGRDGLCTFWTLVDRDLTHRPAPVPKAPGLLISAAARPGGPAAFALIGEDGLLRPFNASFEAARAPIAVPGGRPTALHLDPDGRRAAVGTVDGAVRVVDLATGALGPARPPLAGRVGAIRIGPGGLLAIGAGDALYLAPLDRPDRADRVEAGDSPVESLEFAPGGGWLAARTRTGDLLAWKLAPGRSPEALRLDRAAGGQAAFACLAFGVASGAPTLVAGEDDGGVRRWDLRALKELPRLAPHRGRVRALAASRDGRHLLQVTDDGAAQVWDLREGRKVRTLGGSWAAGAFLPDGTLALARHVDDGGGLAVVDAAEGRPVPGVEPAQPEGPGGDFGRVVASRDGRRVAAISAPGRPESVTLWDLPGGRARTIDRPHDRPLTALDFSDDGRTLLTAAEDGAVRLWDLGDGTRPPARKAEYRAGKDRTISAARLDPEAPGRVVAAGLDPGDRGVVYYWDGRAAGPARLGEFGGKVLAVTFLAKGRYVVAAGRDRALRAWEIAPGRPPEEVDVRVAAGPAGVEPGRHHTEAINDLVDWPGAADPTLASGSDDSTVRFWRVEPADRPRKATLRLLGTLTSAPEEPDAPPPAAPGPARPAPAGADAPWVAFTPEGVYDASLDGERLVTFADGRAVRPLDQYAPRLFRPLLTDQFRRGVPTAANPGDPPPPLLIEAPEELGPGQPEALVRVSAADPGLKRDALRLYQNDVQVRDGDGFEEVSPGEYVARVVLDKGDNRLYAMAGRPGDVDARSRDLTLYHAGAGQSGRLHVIALGVGGYARNALKFPVEDARQFAEYIQRQGVGAGKAKGERVVLPDEKVSDRSVQDAFARVRAAAKGHPEDTVVVFLAGHTDILAPAAADGPPRYSLLLAGFPFPKDDPAQAVLRGPGVAAAARAAPDGTYLPYTAIYKNLTALDALQRLVIVDACQAESVKDDPGVRALEQLKAMDRETRQTRTNYFLASRKGEAAEEAPDLKHGLLTYVMLRGMNAPRLEEPPAEVPELRQPANADLDGDGTITTRELHRYVDRALPILAGRLPGRARGPLPSVLGSISSGRPPDDPRARPAGPSFPLVVLPPPEPARAAAR